MPFRACEEKIGFFKQHNFFSSLKMKINLVSVVEEKSGNSSKSPQVPQIPHLFLTDKKN